VQRSEQLTRVRRRQTARLDRLKRRIAIVSTLAFGTLFGLAAQHTVGSGKRRAVAAVRRVPPVAQRAVSFFDELDGGFAFADPPQAPPETPPIAETSVS
jgi:hypothetical protein